MSMGIGRIVHYILTANDAKLINHRRFLKTAVGNSVGEGEHVPLIVAKVWPDEFGPGIPGVNGQLVLDGNDSHWITSAKEGPDPGQWHWPERD